MGKCHKPSGHKPRWPHQETYRKHEETSQLTYHCFRWGLSGVIVWSTWLWAEDSLPGSCNILPFTQTPMFVKASWKKSAAYSKTFTKNHLFLKQIKDYKCTCVRYCSYFKCQRGLHGTLIYHTCIKNYFTAKDFKQPYDYSLVHCSAPHVFCFLKPETKKNLHCTHWTMNTFLTHSIKQVQNQYVITT